MSITPVRAFALGVVSVFLLAGVFVAGIGIGDSRGDDPAPAADGPMATRIQCPSPSAFVTRASLDRAQSCELAGRAQQVLLDSGVSAANVDVSYVDNPSLIGPARRTIVLAQVVLPDGTWEPAAAARRIATELEVDLHDVKIVDERLMSLFDPDVRAAAPATARPLGPIAARPAGPTSGRTIAVPVDPAGR